MESRWVIEVSDAEDSSQRYFHTCRFEEDLIRHTHSIMFLAPTVHKATFMKNAFLTF